MKDTYRDCASVLVLRPTDVCSPDGCGVVYEILLLHKPRKKDAWQLPQGGVEEGESISEAALRELMEEASLEAELFGESEKKYKYDFPASYRRFRPDHICGQCIHYVFATTDKNAKVTVDQDEIDKYVWVLPEQLPLYLKRKIYLDLVEELVEEATKKLAA